MMPIGHYVFLSFALFLIGSIGVLIRRNPLIVLMSIELILNAVNINFVAFSHVYSDNGGQIFALFFTIVAIAEAAVGLTMAIALFRALHASSSGETAPTSPEAN